MQNCRAATEVHKIEACPRCGASLVELNRRVAAWLHLCRICDAPAGCSQCQPQGGPGLCRSCLGMG